MRRSAAGALVVTLVGLIAATLLIVQLVDRKVDVETNPVVVAALDATSETGLDDQELERIRAIPYLSWKKTGTGDSHAEGVTLFDPQRACDGLNLQH